MARIFSMMLLAAAMAAAPVLAGELSGTYLNDEEGLELSLETRADGTITGRLSADSEWAEISGRSGGTGFTGTLTIAGEQQPVSGRLLEPGLELTVGPTEMAETWVFQRADTGAGVAAPAAPPEHAVAEGPRQVVVNGVRLSDESLEAIEQQYRIRIQNAEYWYDPTCGAWGLQGGPTLGFIPARLALGGPLRPDASGTGTGIFLNGREAHAQDVLALQSVLGPILPGRYFVDAQGNAGHEGGPPLVNLVVASRKAAARGGSGTWRSKLLNAGGGYDGGSSGYVMGRDGSGRSWSVSY